MEHIAFYKIIPALTAAVFLLIYRLWLGTFPSGGKDENAPRGVMLTGVFSALLLDIAAGSVVGSGCSIAASHILLIAAHVSAALGCYAAAGYVCKKANINISALRTANCVILVLYALFIVTSPFTGLAWKADASGALVPGKLAVLARLLPLYYLICAAVVGVREQETLTRPQRAACVIAAVCAAVCTVLMHAVSSGITVCAFGLSAAAFVLLLAFESSPGKAVVQKDLTESFPEQTIHTLAQVIDARDEPVARHSERVSAYSVLLARELGWEEERITGLRYAALLHDIGNIDIPEEILKKHDRLTREETARMQSHTIIGGEILKNIPSLPEARAVARSHHECYDGSGYPDHLCGEEIPITARIVAIAHAYDAMASERSYRDCLPPALIREELERGRGTQFDPKLADIMLRLLDDGRLAEAAEAVSRIESRSGLERASVELINRFTEVMQNGAEPELDELTGLYLRRSGEQRISRAMSCSPGCLAFIDMDRLKRINDTLGHRFGDRILALLGRLLREGDGIASRIGGDEFWYFMPDADKDSALAAMRKLLADFESRKTEIFECVTISAGLCMTTAGMDLAEASACADKALYHVKQNGRGDICLYRKDIDAVSETEIDNILMVTKNLLAGSDYTGALTVEYREFARMFAFLRHMRDRHKTALQFALLTIRQPEDAPEQETEFYASCLQKAIAGSIRATDVVTRYSGRQFLLILTRIEEINIHSVMERVLAYYTENSGDRPPEVAWVYQTMD